MSAELINHHGVPAVKIANSSATAIVTLLGAHVVSYRPTGEQEVLFMSEGSAFREGVAIRGGIPVCWPWFSKNPDNESLPMHGFARLFTWNLDSVEEPTPKQTILRLSLRDSVATRAIWNHGFLAELVITVGDELRLELTSHNLDAQELTISQAFHTYFSVADIHQVSIDGFDGKSCLNKVGEDFTQQGPIRITSEFDAVFQNVDGTSVIHDPAGQRSIVIEKSGSNSGVVWNPWIAKSQRMADFPDDGWKTMVCVETTNAREDSRRLLPNATTEMSVRIRVTR